MVAAVQDVVDGFLKTNRWNGVANPFADVVIAATREQETFRRVKRDGEAFVRLFFLDNGLTLTRWIEPEQVTNPPGARREEGWTYGIQHPMDPYEDVERRQSYWVAYQDLTVQHGPHVDTGEQVDADQVIHIRDRNTDAAVKRGKPFFSFDTLDALRRASKLQRNNSLGAAIRAATAEIWKHDTATKAELQSFSDSQADFRVVSPTTGRTENVEHTTPGTIRRIPAGQEPVFMPESSGASEHLAVAQGDLRQAASAACAPEYMVGSNAENADYSSTKEAGAPFVRKAESEQEHYKAAFLAVVWRAVRWAVECGLLPPQALKLIEIQVEAPAVLHRNELEKAQGDQIKVQGGWKSQQTCAMEDGLDWETEAVNIEEYKERFGQQGPQLPMPGEEGEEGDDQGQEGEPGPGQDEGQDQGQGGEDQNQGQGQDEELDDDDLGPLEAVAESWLYEAKDESQNYFVNLLDEGAVAVHEAEGDREPTAEDDPEAAAGLMADILYGLYGDAALGLLQAEVTKEVREAKDSSGHNHDNDGKFTSGGGGDAKKGRKPGKSKEPTDEPSGGAAAKAAATSEPSAAKEPHEMTREEFRAAHPVRRGDMEDYVKSYVGQYKKGKPGVKFDLQRPDGSGEAVYRDKSGKPVAVVAFNPSAVTDMAVLPQARGKGAVSQLLDVIKKEKGIVAIKGPYTEAGAAVAHRRIVKQALAAGKHVPSKVLADYPNLVVDGGKVNSKNAAAAGEPVRESLLLEAWTEIDHPRGKGGRFIPKGSAQAVAAARDAIGRVLKGDTSGASAEKVLEHLNILTVAQLQALHKEHGQKAPGRLRQQLVDGIKARLEAGKAPKEPVPAPKPPSRREVTSKVFRDKIAKSPHLSESQRQTYSAAVDRVVKRIPEKALEHMAGHVSRVNFHQSAEALTGALADLSPKVRELQAKGYLVGGAYQGSQKKLHLDGLFKGPKTSPDLVAGSDHSIHGPYAHELTHGIDGPSHRFSQTPAWTQAWASEIGRLHQDAPARLTRYAETNHHEGFAEFGRLIYGSDASPAVIESRFPKCSKVFKDNGLWP